MKKALIILNLISILTLSFIIDAFAAKEKLESSNSNSLYQAHQPDGLTSLENYIERSVVCEDEIVNTLSFPTRLNIGIERLDVILKNVKSGDVLKKSDNIDGYIIPYNLRVREIGDDYMIVENIDDTSVEINFLPPSYLNLDNVAMEVRYFDSSLEIISSTLFFDYEAKEYIFNAKVRNTGLIILLNYEKCNVVIKETIPKDGLHIETKFIYNDARGSFVYKLVNVDGEMYYQKKYIKPFETFNTYTRVEGDLHGGNIIVTI